MSLYDNETSAYSASPCFVRLTERNYNRLVKFFADVDLPYMANEYIDNALVDLVNNLCYIKPEGAKLIMEVEA